MLLYALDFPGKRTLEWVVISFSRESSQPRDQTYISCIGRRILYHRATRGVFSYLLLLLFIYSFLNIVYNGCYSFTLVTILNTAKIF